jgi:hypothetical protein
MVIVRRFLTITEGNLNNNHLYLSGLMDMFPDDVVGGPNRMQGRVANCPD